MNATAAARDFDPFPSNDVATTELGPAWPLHCLMNGIAFSLLAVLSVVLAFGTRRAKINPLAPRWLIELRQKQEGIPSACISIERATYAFLFVLAATRATLLLESPFEFEDGKSKLGAVEIRIFLWTLGNWALGSALTCCVILHLNEKMQEATSERLYFSLALPSLLHIGLIVSAFITAIASAHLSASTFATKVFWLAWLYTLCAWVLLSKTTKNDAPNTAVDIATLAALNATQSLSGESHAVVASRRQILTKWLRRLVWPTLSVCALATYALVEEYVTNVAEPDAWNYFAQKTALRFAEGVFCAVCLTLLVKLRNAKANLEKEAQRLAAEKEAEEKANRHSPFTIQLGEESTENGEAAQKPTRSWLSRLFGRKNLEEKDADASECVQLQSRGTENGGQSQSTMRLVVDTVSPSAQECDPDTIRPYTSVLTPRHEKQETRLNRVIGRRASISRLAKRLDEAKLGVDCSRHAKWGTIDFSGESPTRFALRSDAPGHNNASASDGEQHSPYSDSLCVHTQRAADSSSAPVSPTSDGADCDGLP